ncbi:MAG: DUF4383 domain-containing protein [Candidatus Methylomirabilales bacterium]
MKLNRLFGLVFGAVYLLVGLAGFTVTGGVGFSDTQGTALVIFDLNPLHNYVHLGIGALLLLGALVGSMASKGVNILVGVVYLLVGLAGLFLVTSTYNILAINHADNGLHLVTGVLALVIGLRPEPQAA